MRSVLHNPAFLPIDEQVRRFVVRTDALDAIVEAIERNTGPAHQHLLVVGGRGFGKSTLVHRVVAELERRPALASRWTAVVLPQDPYEIGNIGELWLEALRALADSTADPRLASLRAELHRDLDPQRVERTARGALHAYARDHGRRLLLVVEHLDMLLEEQLDDRDGWALRKVLQDDPTFVLLGTALRSFPALSDPSRPLYEAFRKIVLEPLDVPEIEVLWASVTGHAPERESARAIRVLTGGNPRMVALLAEITGARPLTDVVEDLGRLVDQRTDYFKATLDALDGQNRRVFVALASLWRPATAGEVGKEARLEGNTASTVLGRLERKGLVEVVGHRRKNKLYQVAERLHDVFWLMRRRGGADPRIAALLEFMVLFYAPAPPPSDPLVAEVAPTGDPWTTLTRHHPEAALSAWASVTDPTRDQSSAFASAALLSEDRRVWEAALASPLDRPEDELVRVRLEGLSGRPERALAAFRRAARRAEPWMRRPLIPLALSLAAAGQADGVVAGLQETSDPAVFRPLLRALDPSAVTDASAEEEAIADDVRVRLEGVRRRADPWRDPRPPTPDPPPRRRHRRASS